MSVAQRADVQAVIEAAARQRFEEVITSEAVSELGVRRRVVKQRRLLLCQPLTSRGTGATLHLVSIDQDARQVKFRQSFVLGRLLEISHDGNFDATFNFGPSGLLSVSFESHIQREMFVSAVQRLQDALRGPAAGVRRAVGIRGVLTEAVGAQAEADAASRVRKLRQEKRRIFSTMEEQQLLHAMGGTGLDDVTHFRQVLLRRQKEAELSSLDALVETEAAWMAARNEVQSLMRDVQQVEQRLEQYSTRLLSKKAIIQRIEHDNNTLQRRQLNLEQLGEAVQRLRGQLGLDPVTVQTLQRIASIPDEELVAFFSEGNHAKVLSEAMQHMQNVLHSSTLERDYPIAAVAERKAYFVRQRQMVARRSATYLMTIMDAYEAKYLTAKERFSNDTHLTWRLHGELFDRLFVVSEIIKTLARIDAERYTAILRKYRASMQKVYALEVHRFFKCLRRQLKKVDSWRGPFLLGASENVGETAEVSADRTRDSEGGWSESTAPRVWRGSPTRSPALTPRMMRFDGEIDSFSAAPALTSAATGERLVIELPSSLLLTGVELYADPGTLRGVSVRPASTSLLRTLKALPSASSPSSSSASGHIRPDLGFAMALQSIMVAVLQEEVILAQCFGLTEAAVSEEPGLVGEGALQAGKDDDELREETEQGGIHDNAGGAAVVSEGATQTPAQLLRESLIELFGGKDIPLPSSSSSPALLLTEQMQGGPTRRVGRDIGLPPRYPVKGISATGVASGAGSLLCYRGRRDSIASTASASDASGISDDDRAGLRHHFLVAEMVDFTRFFVDECDPLYTVPVICMIRSYRRNTDLLPSRSSFCQTILGEIEPVMGEAVMRFVAAQTASITRCKNKYFVHPTALLHCFANLPAFISRMEATHNILAGEVCDRSEYAAIVASIVDQSFGALNLVMDTMQSGAGVEGGGWRLGEILLRKASSAFDGSATERGVLKRSVVQQFRHYAFFCAFYACLPPSSFVADLLRSYADLSKTRRDRTEELYLTRMLLMHDFPLFGPFILSVEDLALVYSPDELNLHRALAPDAVRKIVEQLGKEFRVGVRASGRRVKKHLMSDVQPGSREESFHRALLQRTWQHFSRLLMQKYAFFAQILKSAALSEIALPFTDTELQAMLAAC